MLWRLAIRAAPAALRVRAVAPCGARLLSDDAREVGMLPELEDRALYLLSPLITEEDDSYEWTANGAIAKHAAVALVPNSTLLSRTTGYRDNLLPQSGSFIRQALMGYADVKAADPRRYDLMEMALISYFAARTGSPLGDWMTDLARRRGDIAKLVPGSKDAAFFNVFIKSIAVDLAPVVDIVQNCLKAEMDKAPTEELAPASNEPASSSSSSSFESEMETYYALAQRYGVDLANSKSLSRPWRRHGHAVLLPGLSTLPHATGREANATLALAQHGTTPPDVLQAWAGAFGSASDTEFLDSSVLLVAARDIAPGERVRRDYGFKSQVRARDVFGVELGQQQQQQGADAEDARGTTLHFFAEADAPRSAARSASPPSQKPPRQQRAASVHASPPETKSFDRSSAAALLAAHRGEDDDDDFEPAPQARARSRPAAAPARAMQRQPVWSGQPQPAPARVRPGKAERTARKQAAPPQQRQWQSPPQQRQWQSPPQQRQWQPRPPAPAFQARASPMPPTARPARPRDESRSAAPQPSRNDFALKLPTRRAPAAPGDFAPRKNDARRAASGRSPRMR